jgi:hypothetical protein
MGNKAVAYQNEDTYLYVYLLVVRTQRAARRPHSTRYSYTARAGSAPIHVALA